MREPRLGRPEAIKVLIADVPALLASVVRHTVDGELDMMVVEQIGSADELTDAVQGTVDVVVTASPASEQAPEFQALLFGPSPLPIVTISPDGERIDVYGRSIIRGGGIEGLTGLIRDAVAGARPRIGG